MKSLKIISNPLSESGNKIIGSFFFLSLTSYISGVILWYSTETPYLLILCFPAAPLLLYGKGRFFKIAVLILFLSLGALRASFIYQPDSKTLYGYGKIISMPREREYYKEAIIGVDKASSPTQKQLTIRFPKDFSPILADYIYFEGTFRAPLFYRNDNEFPVFYNNYLQKRYYIKAENLKVLKRNTLIDKLNGWKDELRSGFLNLGPGGKYFFIEVLFGERLISDQIREIFNYTGTSHLLSISGLHFSLTVFFAYLIALLISTIYPSILLKIPRPYLTIILSIPILFVYGFLSGLSVPAFRAFLVFLFVSLFLLLNQRVYYFSLLCLIALIFLIFNPNYIFSISFQLSFLSVGALILSAHKYGSILQKINNRGLKYFTGILAGTLSITIVTLPVITNLQEKIIFSGIISNLIAIPIFSFCILPFLFISIALFFISPSLFSYLLIIPDKFFELLLYLLKNIKELMVFHPIDFYFDFKTTLIYYALIISLLFFTSYYRTLLIILFVIILIWTERHSKIDFSVVFLDVGQGESAMMFSDDRKAVMIDCGGNIYDENIFRNSYAPFLRKYGIKEIEAVVVSHPHPDHTKALKDLTTLLRVKKIYFLKDYESYFSHPFENTILSAVEDKQEIILKGMKISIIPPDFRDKKLNNNSLWTVVNKGERIFVFTGDTEKRFIPRMLKQIERPDAKKVVLKVPHHGSKSSLEESLYHKLNPQWAVISVGRDNLWNLPSPEVLDYLKKKKITYYRTDIDGAVKF